SVSKDYNLEIEKVDTMFLAIEDEYETSFESREYESAYKWILELTKKEPNREEVILFNKFRNGTATDYDIEQALIYADRLTSLYPNKRSEEYLSKDIFKKILEYTSFSFSLVSVQKSKLREDFDAYIEAFIQGRLERNERSKGIGNTFVYQSQNIFTFKKHNELFKEYLQKMQDNFGNVITIENEFEDRFPNSEYPQPEFIRDRYEKRNFFFLHILFAFEKLGLIKLWAISTNWNLREEKMLTFQAKIELLPKFFNEDISKTLDFDTDKSRLYVQGKEIKIQKFSDQYNVLKILFKNKESLSEEWFYSKIAELLDRAEDFKDKKFYNAIYQINQKIAKETEIKNFFITTNQSFKIDNKYLAES
ncbi:hypothetical protein L6278_00875, partial [Candidatus Parcubacteria bacterium]|nr:hypothetical protein [Candidatus Parcubacteria bacterium]